MIKPHTISHLDLLPSQPLSSPYHINSSFLLQSYHHPTNNLPSSSHPSRLTESSSTSSSHIPHIKTMKLVHTFFILALAMALVTASFGAPIKEEEEEEEEEEIPLSKDVTPSTGFSYARDQPSSLRGASRFLDEKKRSRGHKCNKNPKICKLPGSPGPDCCNNKCVNLRTDHQNCGVCGHKCMFTTGCCRGECVYLAFDKRHCGRCNNKCKKGIFCIYGLCNYG